MPATKSQARSGLVVKHWPLALILVGYVLLTLAYSVATPIGESPDEPTHFEYVLHLLEGRGLPVIPEPDEHGLVQAKHPPLYYLAGAAIGFWADYSTLGYMPNPHFSFNFERAKVPNAFVHFDHEAFPYTAAEGFLGARVMRLLSLMCGVVVVWAAYRLAQLVWPAERHMWWAAAGVVAFLPGFVFFSGVFNNDAMANMWMALILLWSTRVALGRPGNRDLALLGVFVGLGLMTKLTAASGVAVAGLGLLAHAYRGRDWRAIPRAAALIGTPVVLLSGWWFARNVRLYGLNDPLGLTRWAASVQEIQRDRPLATELRAYFWVQLTTFWARFGWEAVRLPDTVYRLLLLFMLLVAAGLVLVALRRSRLSANTRWGLALVGASVLVMYLAVFRLAFSFNLIVAHGRYLYVALTGLGVLFVAGLMAYFPQRWRPTVAAATVALYFTLSLTSLLLLLIPAYETPEALEPPPVSENLRMTPVVYDWRFRLYDYELSATRLEPGEPITVTLYWSSLPASWEPFPPPVEGHIVFLHLIDSSGEVAGRTDAMPFDGTFPTTAWPPRKVYSEALSVSVSPEAAPGVAYLLVGLYEAEEPWTRLPTTVDGVPVGDAYRIEPLLIAPLESDDVAFDEEHARADRFGDVGSEDAAWAQLLGFDTNETGATLTVTLYWEAMATPQRDYTVFVHLVAPDGTLAATGDSPPKRGKFPTSLWSPGDIIVDTHAVQLPPGGSVRGSSLRVGLYEPDTGARVPAWTEEGTRWADDAVDLGALGE